MPGPTRHARSDVFCALDSQSEAAQERADCSVKALAIVAGVPYAEAHAALAKHGRKPRARTPEWTFCRALDELGFVRKLVPVPSILARYPGRHATCIKNVTTHHPDRFPEAWRDGRTYLLYPRGHVLAVVDGVNHDWTRGRALRVRNIYEVVPKGAVGEWNPAPRLVVR